MKNLVIVFTATLFLLLSGRVSAQQGFGTNAPVPSSVIDMVAADKGALLPRVALTGTNAASPVSSPANALTVFNTATAGTSPNNVTPGYYYWSTAGSKWVRVLDATSVIPNIYSADGSLAADRTVTQEDKNLTFASTTGNLIFNPSGTGKVGIGTTSPVTKLEVVNTAETKTAGSTIRVFNNTTPTIDNFAGIQFKSNNDATATGGSWKIGANQETASGSDQNFHFVNSFNGSQFSTKMIITPTGNVGIGTTAPLSKLEVIQSSLYTNNETFPHGLVVTSGKTNTDYGFYMGADKTTGLGYVQALKWGVDYAPFSLNPRGGNVGVGVANPTSKLEVNGAATNTTAFNAAAGTTIDFSKSNLAYTTASPGAFILNNLKDGGTYTLAVKGTTSGTAGFTSTGFTFLSVNNGPTISGKQTLYTFIVMGTTVYVYMAAGF